MVLVLEMAKGRMYAAEVIVGYMARKHEVRELDGILPKQGLILIRLCVFD